MNTKETKNSLSVQIEGRTLTVGNQVYEIEFALSDYVLLELLERYDLSLDFVKSDKISNYLTLIESALNGKLPRFRLLGNTITDREVNALKTKYFETYVKVKLDGNSNHHFTNYFESNNVSKPKGRALLAHAEKKNILTLTLENPEATVVRKITFLKQGSYEIVVHEACNGTYNEKIKAQLKLDLNHRLFRGIWVDAMVLKENNVVALRCVNLFSREILLEEERGERQYGL